MTVVDYRPRELGLDTAVREPARIPVPAAISAVVLDRQRLFARGLAVLLEDMSGGQVAVVAHSDDAREAANLVRRYRPGLLIVGLDLEAPGPAVAIGAARRQHPGVQIAALCADDDPQAATAALRAGASGVLLRSADPEAVVAPLLAMTCGVSVIPTGIMDHILRSAPARHDIVNRLSVEDLRLWRLIAEGEDSAAMARRAVRLPAHGETDGRPPVPPARRDQPGAGCGPGRPVRAARRRPMRTAPSWVLVVDDDVDEGLVAFRLLERDGHHATVVASGREALDLLASEPFDLVLVDLGLSHPDGYSLLAAIRQDPALRHIPVAHLHKPLDPAKFRNRVRASLTRKELQDSQSAGGRSA